MITFTEWELQPAPPYTMIELQPQGLWQQLKALLFGKPTRMETDTLEAPELIGEDAKIYFNGLLLHSEYSYYVVGRFLHLKNYTFRVGSDLVTVRQSNVTDKELR